MVLATASVSTVCSRARCFKTAGDYAPFRLSSAANNSREPSGSPLPNSMVARKSASCRRSRVSPVCRRSFPFGSRVPAHSYVKPGAPSSLTATKSKASRTRVPGSRPNSREQAFRDTVDRASTKPGKKINMERPEFPASMATAPALGAILADRARACAQRRGSRDCRRRPTWHNARRRAG